MVDIDAHKGGGALVLRHAAHGAADAGLLGEQVQRHHNDGGDRDGDDGGVADGDAAHGDGVGKQGVGHPGVRADGRDGLGQILQHKAHGDGGDETGQAVAGPADRPVGQQLYQHAHAGTDDDGRDHRQPARQAHAHQQRDGEKQRVAPHHDKVAVGEVDQLDDPVDHGVAQGDQRVDAAQAQARDQKLDECDHSSSLFSSWFVPGPARKGRKGGGTPPFPL